MASGVLSSCSPSTVEQQTDTSPGEQAGASFRHRGYLGWITDFATHPDRTAMWPSMELDDDLLADYRRKFELMKRLGYNEMSVWGLYVSRAWPVDIESSVTAERGEKVEQLLEMARQNGVRVYSGLGVYSWGFEQIIKVHPELSRGNARAMCPQNEHSWDWMRRVIDFVFDRFPIDGVSMQSADQGRCSCDECSRYGEAAYHALLNLRCAEYIRERQPDKTVAVNSWGMKFDEPDNLEALVRMGKKVDYIIDTHDSSRRRDPAYRRQLIDSLDCAFGTTGGPQVEPPQHWQRDRWFLPTAKRQGEHLAALHQDGGLACEYFYHILENPGDEISFHMAGRMLSDPETPWENHLRSTLEELFETTNEGLLESLANLVVRSEDAYFQHLPSGIAGTISMEPLVSDKPGPPVYLSKRLDAEQRRSYGQEMEGVREGFQKLLTEAPRRDKVEKIVTCLGNVLDDVANASG